MCSFNICLPVTQQSVRNHRWFVSLWWHLANQGDEWQVKNVKETTYKRRLRQSRDLFLWPVQWENFVAVWSKIKVQEIISVQERTALLMRELLPCFHRWRFSHSCGTYELLSCLCSSKLFLDQFNSDRIANHSQRSGRSLSVWVSLNIVLVCRGSEQQKIFTQRKFSNC